MQPIPSKHKDVVTTFSQCRAIDCNNVASSLEMKVSPMSVDNVMAMLQNRNFGKCLATSFQRCVSFASGHIFLFIEKLPLFG